MTALRFLLAYPTVALVIALVPVLAIRWFAIPAARKATEWLMVLVIFFVPVNLVIWTPLRWLSGLNLPDMDLYLCRFDALLGYPGFHIGQLAQAHLWLRGLIDWSYSLATAAVFVPCALYILLRPGREALRVIAAFALNSCLACLCYTILPACGPRYAFASWPAIPAALALHPVYLLARPNCVPSIHFSTALLFCWALWRWPLGRAAGLIFVALTALATLGNGEHYVFDLLCALPYAAAMVWLTGERGACTAAQRASKPAARPCALIPSEAR